MYNFIRSSTPLTRPLTRRAILRSLGAGATMAFAGGAGLLLQSCSPASQPTQPGASASSPTTTKSSNGSPAFLPDIELKLTAAPGETKILPGATTNTWSYHGEVMQGDANVLINLSDTYLGPILRLRKGQKVRIHLQNELPQETIVHWHGLIVPPQADGHPSDQVAGGKSYVYEFEVVNRAGTYWFHPHTHGKTASQVIKGLAGLVIVSDDEEAALALPDGEFDLPIIIQDRTFDTLNQFVYNAEPMGNMNGMSGMDNMNMTSMMGFLGESILVNGHPNFTLPVANRAYRLRLLNGSNARIYKLAWSNQTPMTVIATDGGLLEKPVQRDYVTLAPGERVELWADFSQLKKGTEIKLRSLEYSGVETGMEMGAESGLVNGAAFDVLTVYVQREEAGNATLTETLSSLHFNQPQDALNSSSPRPFELTMNTMQWLINGRQFEMDAVDASEKVALNSLELWEFINQQGAGTMSGGMMNDFMAHPMHIHGVQFQIVERQIDPTYAAGWQTLKDGYVDEGWKDSVLVMPGERVKLLLHFNEYAGRYLLHCHNLEHENAGMMRNYLIEG